MDIDVKNTEKRSTCLVCKSKKERKNMVKHGQHWTCKQCLLSPPVEQELPLISGKPPVSCGKRFRVLNLYCGLGGNRKLWQGDFDVTAVELNTKIAAAYKTLYPGDTVICGDALKYLVNHFHEYDFIWASPSCVTHSRMNYFKTKRLPDLSLYQVIIFLKSFFKGKWLVENVTPYYTPLIPFTCKIDRHVFWSNFTINQCFVPDFPGFIECCNIADKQRLMEWLGIYYEPHLYLSGKNYTQVFKNCVHPTIGLSIFNDAFNCRS